eukprot:CAMPEP_0185619486 /NCGR_PEP_ID=MMETSP0436-20130131/50761_1 /TAXON_ID=626734 ORGANISM="Favella taraikaensis, Strain Fe Narragansett Bay" /NCGR_SAMPLE_ID=MMETSP0436 /ASSEMBLY_ACC=CAM_ASM_000390 /LENGTH=62 /DNA_ID=CAMNT_0028258997 /DNA_START=175 /DNA_END=363 /DNA_ORIENTATION=+
MMIIAMVWCWSIATVVVMIGAHATPRRSWSPPSLIILRRAAIILKAAVSMVVVAPAFINVRM